MLQHIFSIIRIADLRRDAVCPVVAWLHCPLFQRLGGFLFNSQFTAVAVSLECGFVILGPLLQDAITPVV